MADGWSVVAATPVLVLALALGGCGGTSHRNLGGRDVLAAFQKAGISLTEWGGSDGISEYVLGRGGAISVNRINQLDVQVFPTVKEADAVRAIGGNIETDGGRQIAPFAVVRNVVVTIGPTAGLDVRTRSKRAVNYLTSTRGR